MKRQNVMEEDWDYLLILDACRYDYFKGMYNEYLEGDLERRNSGAGSTMEWLPKTFNDGMNHDVSYFSGNAYINSLGLTLEDLGVESSHWKATEHFGLIVDVWDEGWNNDYQTVLPQTIFDYLEKSPSLDRVIMHFVQPHCPYLHPQYSAKYGAWNNRDKIKKSNESDDPPDFYEKVKNYVFSNLLGKIFEDDVRKFRIRKIANEFINVPSYKKFEKIYRNYNLKEIKNFYKHNLRTLLKVISKNKNVFDGKVVITSDHGECLGENNLLGHQSGVHVKELIEVPWFILKS